MISFLKFHEGAIPGRVSKRAPTADAGNIASEKCKKYENKRPERVFSDSWKISRDWLEFDKENKTVKCKLCVKHNDRKFTGRQNLKGQNPFIMNGSTNLKKSAVIDDEQSKAHIAASQINEARQSN